MANRVPITLNLDTFEGPLDLLLHLIAEHEMDVSKLSISKITDQYLAHVLMMQELNFDLASEFLVMAATLVLWKSKALLPKEESGDLSLRESADEILTPEQLLRQLLEHQRFLDAGVELGRLPKLGEDVFSKDNQEPTGFGLPGHAVQANETHHGTAQRNSFDYGPHSALCPASRIGHPQGIAHDDVGKTLETRNRSLVLGIARAIALKETASLSTRSLPGNLPGTD